MSIRILSGDCRDVLKTLESESVHCVVTSPPYFGLRDYQVAGQIGLEPTPDAYVAELVAVFRDVRRVLRKDGTLWLNLGDSYSGGGGFSPDAPSNRNGSKQTTQASRTYKGREPTHGLKPKDLIGIPWRVAFALQADGWWLRQDIIWAKPNPMPESVTDRCTKAHEYLFLLSKSERYFYDAEAIAEGAAFPGVRNAVGSQSTTEYNGNQKDTRNRRSVWTITTQPFAEAHFATFPPELPELCIKAGCPIGGTVLDTFGGAGTTGLVADRLGRNAILIELNPEYGGISERRIRGDAPLFTELTFSDSP